MATRFRWTNTAGRFMAMGLSLAITLSCADSDEVNDYAATHALNFGVSLSNEWHTPLSTRSDTEASDEASDWTVSKFDNGDLWLITSTEPNTDSPFDRSPQTRAASVTNDKFHNTFAVYGYAYKGTAWNNRTDVVTWFAGDKVSNKNGIWTTDEMKYWPGDDYRMHFFAIAPHPDDAKDPSPTNPADPDDAGSLAITLAEDNCTPATLDYTVPTKVTAQKDLVVATEVDLAGNHNQSVDLQFKHILTAVKIKAAYGMTGTVTRVVLAGIQNKGTYDFSKKEWNSITDSSAKDFVVDNLNIQLTNDENGTPIIDGDNTFMMIPQFMHTTSENASRLEITIDGKTTTHTLSAVGTWKQGQCVTYIISDKEVKVEYQFTASDKVTFTGEGGTNPVEIQSYKTANGVNKTTVTWENAGYYSKTADGNYTPIEVDATPDWLLFPTYQAGTTNYNVDVYHQYKGSVGRTTGKNDRIIIKSKDKELQEMTEPADQTPKNLAGADGAETTANCYIVNGPGWYKFPIVYGNALKNGAPNPAAYNGACFVNHLDQRITKPWIKDNGVTVGSAQLIWQDCPDSAPFIEQVAVEGDYIKFHIPAGNTCVQGNALIAIKDADGEIAWSWHIWLTTHKPNDTFQFGSYHFFNALLGYREAELAICPEREVFVKLVQNGSNKEAYVHVSQDQLYQFVAAGNAPYYQHGRKDPFPGASLKVDRNDGKYSAEVLQDRIREFGAETVNGNTTLGYVIKHPDTFIGQYAKNTNWYWYVGKGYGTHNGIETGYKNLWDNNGIKTVFDPCPAGYKVPVVAAMKTVENAKDVEYVNTGMYFINNKGLEGEQRFFLQILCSRNYDTYTNSEIKKKAEASLHCSDGNNGSTSAQYLLFNGTQYWVAGGTICAGRCILPQKE